MLLLLRIEESIRYWVWRLLTPRVVYSLMSLYLPRCGLRQFALRQSDVA